MNDDDLLRRMWRSLREIVDLLEGRHDRHHHLHVVLTFQQKENVMSTLTITLGNTDTGAITAADAAGTEVPVTFDAGSVVATLSDLTTATATVSPDQLSVTIHGANVTTTPNTLTIAASVAGVALTPAIVEFDVIAVPGPVATQVVVTFPPAA